MKRATVLAAICFLAFLMGTDSVLAQQKPYAPYRPARPTISPYFDLFRRDGGPLGPYQTYYRPQRQLESELQQQQYGIRSLQSNVQRLEGNLQQAQSGAGTPTGVGSGFQTQRQYFGTHNSYFRLGGK